MAEAASAQQAASATAEDTSEQRAGRRRRTSAEPRRAHQGASAAAAPAALDTLSRLQQLADASPQGAQLRRLQALADASPQAVQLRRLQALADNHYAPVAQLAGDPEEEELIQGNFASAEVPPQRQQAPRTNNSGLPDQLKSGIESLSGLSMDPVRVHYNSAQPAQLNALAYAQGSEIHVAPGQEQQLPHQAWHVVQQAQGQVRPTLQLKDGVQVNDDAGLEREADVMGSKALEGGHRAVETHRSISMPIDTAQRIEGDALNSPEAIVANNHSAPLANGRGSAQRGGNEMQRIAYQCAQAALQRQVQAWGDGSDRVEQLWAWQGVADGREVGGKRQDLTPGFTAPRQAQERGGHLSTQLASSPRQLAQRRLIGQMLGSAVQRVEGELDEEEGGAAQLRSEPVQRVEDGLDEEEPPAAAQLLAEPAQLEENRTGMPDGLKVGIESLSGMDTSDVRVHRNSSAPAQLNALAYAQGNDIHLGPGQEQHLPHEAWHVVQQRQGRVQATMQMAGVGVNDDVGLEREADVMGGRAVQMRTEGDKRQDLPLNPAAVQAACLMPRALVARAGSVLQAAWATVQDTLARLNLAELKGQLSPGGKQLYVDNKTGLQYEWVSGTTNDDRVVKVYAASHSSSKPLQSEYENWDSTKTTSEEMKTPFGKASARHSRGAPFAQTNKTDYGGNGVGDSYTDMIYSLRDGSHDTSDDAGLATALLELDETKLDTDLQKNAAAKLTVTVNLAEEWRKQGAGKIWRALMRLVGDEKINLDRAKLLFAFVKSADAGRQQVALFQDVYEEDMSESELSKDERMIYGAMSPINQDDFSSDDEMRKKKELKTKRRLYATKHQQDDDSD